MSEIPSVLSARVRGVPADPSGWGHTAASAEEVLTYRTDCYRPAFPTTASLCFLPKCLSGLKEVEIEEDSSDDEDEEDDDDDIESLPQDPETCLQMNHVYQEVIKEKIEEVELLIAQNRKQQVGKAGVECSFCAFLGCHLPCFLPLKPRTQVVSLNDESMFSYNKELVFYMLHFNLLWQVNILLIFFIMLIRNF